MLDLVRPVNIVASVCFNNGRDCLEACQVPTAPYIIHFWRVGGEHGQPLNMKNEGVEHLEDSLG